MNPNNSINPKNHRKRILLISYYYPPLADTGCRRSVAFAKYFKKYGWEPYVLSVKNPDKTYCSLGNEERPYGINTGYTYSIVNLYKFFGKLNAIFSLIMKIFGIKISRNYFYDLFCIPDIFWGWIPLTTYRGYKLVKKFDIDIIYVSCTPFSGAVIGILLKMMTKKFLIIDFRDPYAFAPESFNYHLRPNFRKKIDAWLENKFVDYADIFLVVTEELRDLYIHHYPKAKDKIFTIYNGIDTEIIKK